ncbi:hypothetical protein ACJIZ3_003219 [Penstemon smallii]|uniref:F-box domain-containing protein n=1 Tax=Penstemon smallii TaxID=265156 RepID=A0ABD3UA65_9LAMI
MASGPDNSDVFDLLPDPILLLILNQVSDIKTLLQIRSVSKRFNSLVPQSDSLLLRVDRVIPTSTNDDVSFISTILKSLLHLISPSSKPDNPTRPPNSPSRILRTFESIKNLQIELPAGDLRLEKETIIKYVARFGKTLNSCVILAFTKTTNPNPNPNPNTNQISDNGNLKARVVWTISALIAASARHYMIRDVIEEQNFLSNLLVTDRENEGTVVMDEDGLREFRESGGGGGEVEEDVLSYRTRVPPVRMRMRHEVKLELSGGVVMEGATLVVVRPAVGGELAEEEELAAAEVFGNEGVYAEAVKRLMKCRSYVLEMNSF